MSKYRRAAKVDINQQEIVRKLRQIPGVTVVPGHDDILVGRNGKTYWFEVKRPECIGKDGNVRPSEITESEKELLASWRGHYKIVSTFEEIMDEINGGVNTHESKYR